jgi:hypothetical protein
MEFDGTMSARVMAYQQARGLTKDGVAGPKTFGMLATGEPNRDPAPVIDLRAFPLLLALAKNGGDEQGVYDFFNRAAGVDLAAIMRDMDSALNAQSEVTS